MAELELIRVDKYSEQTMTHLLEQSDYPRQLGLFELCCATNMAYLLYVDGKLVGFIAICISRRREFEVCALYIIPSERRKGYASQFMAHIWSIYKGCWKVKKEGDTPSSRAFWHAVLNTKGKSAKQSQNTFDFAV